MDTTLGASVGVPVGAPHVDGNEFYKASDHPLGYKP